MPMSKKALMDRFVAAKHVSIQLWYCLMTWHPN